MLLEVFSKETLVGEIHVDGYFFDAFGGIFQQDSALHCHVIVYPLVRGAVTNLLDGLGEIFRGDVHLHSIPSHTALSAEVLFHEFDERGEHRFRSCHLLVCNVLYAIDGVAHVINHCCHHRLYCLPTEMVVVFVHFLLDHSHIVDDGVRLFWHQRADGMASGKEEKG